MFQMVMNNMIYFCLLFLPSILSSSSSSDWIHMQQQQPYHNNKNNLFYDIDDNLIHHNTMNHFETYLNTHDDHSHSSDHKNYIDHNKHGILSKMNNKNNYNYKVKSNQLPKDLQYHGTTTLSFIHGNQIILCVDSKASIGNYIGSRTVKKIFPISQHIVATMAGGAADCAYWIRAVSSFSRKLGLTLDTFVDTKAIAYILSSILKSYRGHELSVGTMIIGIDKYNHHYYRPSIYYVDSEGVCINGELFCVGSGAPFAYAVLDYYRLQHNSNDDNNNVAALKTSSSDNSNCDNYDSNADSNDDDSNGDDSIRRDNARIHHNQAYMKGLSKLSIDDAVAVAIKAVRHATYRDGYSGGYINAFIINSTGIHHVHRVDSKTIKIGSISLQTIHP